MGVKVGEGYIILLGGLIRIALYYLADPKFFKSLTYSVADGWESVLEGVAFKKEGISPYLSDISFQAPLVLNIFIWAHSLIEKSIIIIFLAMEVGMLYTLIRLADVTGHYLLHIDKPFTHDSKAKSLLICREDLTKVRFLIITVYCLNPFLILSFHAMNITTLYTILIGQFILAIIEGGNTKAAILCACLTYCQPYYALLGIPLVSHLLKDYKQLTSSMMMYVGVLVAAFFLSFILEGEFTFLKTVYFNTLTFSDGTPHLNMYWYFFGEMFDHFRELFVATIHISAFTSCILLAMKDRNDPLFLLYCTWFFVAIVKPYPSIGEVGTVLSLLPIWSHLYTKGSGQFNLIPYGLLVSVLCLAPLMHYLWLYAGSANANFYFAISLLYSLTQALILGGLLRLHALRNAELKYGFKPKLSDGTALIVNFSS